MAIWYATQIPTTEINGSFYRTPSLEAVRNWRNQTPKDFLFSWKASKFITHWKRLSEKSDNSTELMETRLRTLSPKAGAVLFQLPPQFQKESREARGIPEVAAAMLSLRIRVSTQELVPRRYLHAPAQHDVSLCLSDHHNAPSPWEVTARHVYIRGHGPGGRYKDSYPDKTLRAWARDIRKWKRQRRTVFVYFDNDQKSAAPKDAQRLIQMLDKVK